MLKFFYRLKKRGGVVLFAVIAIMTLLIAMASTAYFTARSSYKTVVSNYNFSQMYLSATSVSDMLIAAATQDSQHSGDAAAPKTNFFKNLKEEIQKLKDKTPGSPDAQIVAVSSNIYGKTTESDIFEAGASNPIEEGIVDAVKVVITLEEKLTHDDYGDIPVGLTNYYYSFTTTAYYKENSVTVQDIIYNQAGEEEPPGPSAVPDFNSFFTATGQELKADGTKDKGTRVVIIDTKEISDKAYFQSRNTVFLGNKFENTFKGGITSSGSVFLCRQCTLDVEPPSSTDRHDWFIGGDLGLLHTNISFDLKGNSLYVKGDLIVSAQNGIVNAENIVVEGNIYVLRGKFPISSTTNLYVGGDIIASDNLSSLNLGGTYTLRNGAWHTVGQEIDGIKSAVNLASTRATVTGGESFAVQSDIPSTGEIGNPWNFHGTLKQGSGSTLYFSGGSPVSSSGTYDPNTINVDVAVRKSSGHTYYTELEPMTVAELFDTTFNGSPIRETTFKNYTAKEETFENLLELDFTDAHYQDTSAWSMNPTGTYGTIEFETKSGLAASGERFNDGTVIYTFHSTNDQEIIVEAKGDDYTIKIPWCKEGYRLYVKPGMDWGNITIPTGGNGTKKWLIETKASEFETDPTTGQPKVKIDNTMPIVLMGNINDGSSKQSDENGNNAFAWKGQKFGSNDYTEWVLLTDDTFEGNADGNVLFEMGNLDADGHYIPYKFGESTNSITYLAGQKEVVCTLGQKEKMNTDSPWENGNVQKLLKPGTSDPEDEYENRVMLVSNQNSGTAVNAYRFMNLFCGYIYAPNGSYLNFADGKVPVFGGLIVSDYAAIHAYYIYAEPDPLIIQELINSVDDGDDPTPPPSSSPTGGIWYTGSDRIMGRNYLG